MNFLGHIYFSNGDPELMHANLFGDFVKGSNLDRYLPKVREGITLHRTIDTYIGQHPDVRKLLLRLSPSLPKVAGIAIDIYFDHFLAIHWKDFHADQLTSFLETFYTHRIDEEHYPDELFLQTLFRLKKGRWLSGYAHLDGIEGACIGVSRRISFPNSLMNGRMVLEENYSLVEEAFFQYMNDAIPYFNRYFLGNGAS